MRLSSSLSLLVGRREPQSVRVKRQGFGQEVQVLALVEADRVAPEQPQRPVGSDALQPSSDRIDVDGRGLVALQSQHHRLVAAVPLAGRAERSVQPDVDVDHSR